MQQCQWHRLLSIKQYIIMIMKDKGKIIQNMADGPSRERRQGMTKTDVIPLKHCHSCLTILCNHHVIITNCGKLIPNFKKIGHIAQKLKWEENILNRKERKGEYSEDYMPIIQIQC